MGELSCPGTLFECMFVSLSFGRSLSGVRVMLLCCFTSTVNIYSHVGTVS